MRVLLASALALALTGPAYAQANEPTGWRIVGAPGEPVFALTSVIAIDRKITWTFQCEPETVAIMQTRVTELMDLSTGQKVSDTPLQGAVLPPGAAVMGVMVDKGDTGLLPAAAKANPDGGWDMLIRLPRSDRTFAKMAKTKMIVLMTTGFTAAVSLESDDRAVIADFVERCRKA